jgi:hypothetical protein
MLLAAIVVLLMKTISEYEKKSLFTLKTYMKKNSISRLFCFAQKTIIIV